MSSQKIQNPFSSEPEFSLDSFEAQSDSIAAHFIRTMPKQPIAFLADKSIQHCLHLYAAFKAGNPFYHINFQVPLLKKIEILKKLKIEIIFIDRKFSEEFEQLKKHMPELQQLFVVNPTSQSFQKLKDQNDICYYISTSGTTGEPKLIGITYGQLEGALTNIQRLIQLDSNDSFLHISQLCFDVAIADFFLPLKNKSSMILIPQDNILMGLEVALKNNITVWSSSPSLLKYCDKFSPPVKMNHLKKVIHCGEAFDENLAKIWNERAPEAELINLYGPAEATIAISGFKTKQKNSFLPIGPLFPGHTSKHTEDGELLIRGPQLIKSYVSGESIIDSEGFYHTGDFFEEIANLGLKFLGRKDQQIKIGGMRFNILEIEHFIKRSFPQIMSAVVFENESLILMIEKNEMQKLTPEIIKKSLSPFIPSIFIPKKIVEIEKLPLNSSGKLDRKALTSKPEQK